MTTKTTLSLIIQWDGVCFSHVQYFQNSLVVKSSTELPTVLPSTTQPTTVSSTTPSTTTTVQHRESTFEIVVIPSPTPPPVDAKSCPSEHRRNISWPVTPASVVARRPCPNNKDGELRVNVVIWIYLFIYLETLIKCHASGLKTCSKVLAI